MPTDAVSRPEDAPTTELVATAAGERCANCHATLATDQRYCVNCGERRGKARFSASDLAPAAPVAAGSAPPPAAPRRSRAQAGAAYAAGVAVLLIAMGVGVLIGTSKNSPPAGTGAIHVTVNAGGGYAGAPAAPNTNTTASTPTSKKKAKTVVVHVTPKVAKAAQQAASKVLGSGGSLSHNVTQQQGGSCNGGAGCQGGKFTGNFFGN